MTRWLLLLALLLSSGRALAQQGQHAAGDYTVHYNALPSAFLTPEIARQYGVLRSRVRGVLVVSVLRQGSPVRVRVEAQAGAPGEPLQPLELRLVETNGTPSYIGSFAIASGESRQFRLRVEPPDDAPIHIGFTRQFFDDPP